jgi:hypothetical protein
MGAEVFKVDRAADERRQRGIIGLFSRDEQTLVGQIADARREFKPEQMHQGKHMIREARRIGVVLLDAQVGFVVQETIEHISRIAHADIDHLRAERRVLVGDMGVEQPARVRSVLRVDVAGALAPAAAGSRGIDQESLPGITQQAKLNSEPKRLASPRRWRISDRSCSLNV